MTLSTSNAEAPIHYRPAQAILETASKHPKASDRVKHTPILQLVSSGSEKYPKNISRCTHYRQGFNPTRFPPSQSTGHFHSPYTAKICLRAGRSRTGDLLVPNQARYHLRYCPETTKSRLYEQQIAVYQNAFGTLGLRE